MRPLLNALVQASDFHFRLEPRDDPERLHVFVVKSAIGQRLPLDALLWDKQAFAFTGKLLRTSDQGQLFEHDDESDDLTETLKL